MISLFIYENSQKKIFKFYIFVCVCVFLFLFFFAMSTYSSFIFINLLKKKNSISFLMTTLKKILGAVTTYSLTTFLSWHQWYISQIIKHSVDMQRFVWTGKIKVFHKPQTPSNIKHIIINKSVTNKAINQDLYMTIT